MTQTIHPAPPDRPELAERDGARPGAASPTASRLRRPTWRDPRLLIGVVVIACSVALGSWAVGSASRTVPVYAAAGVLLPGDPVAAQDLRIVDVQLGPVDDGYVHADAPLPDDAVMLRALEPGELVRPSAYGSAEDLEVRSVAVPVTTGLSDRIAPGTQVDLWYVPAEDAAEGDDDAPRDPVELVSDVTVAQVDEGGGSLVAGGPVTVHTLVPVADLPTVLSAVTGEGDLAVVPRGGA
ncbi:hypothetical protein [Cellulosimicrobium arenosum]|uniref:SAF domain-containing protein n=1 Tax=Cellulosimicrobium arenosum TaxID=2708133 RepID=A0A927J2G0_9MICO|nr:hypothetical protein [Cellulosimicrobium arenosum]MBD8080709.1 hypothetical protein [Cellulosimicrobium arenosum]